jgi:transposase
MKTPIPAVEKLTIGIDLGDRQHAVCVLSPAGEILAEETLPNSRECLTAFAQRHPAATFVMETGTHSPWVSRLLQALGHEVIVANARKLRAIAQSHTKNDQEDARMLARLGRADPKLLSPVKHRSESAQRALVQLKGTGREGTGRGQAAGCCLGMTRGVGGRNVPAWPGS